VTLGCLLLLAVGCGPSDKPPPAHATAPVQTASPEPIAPAVTAEAVDPDAPGWLGVELTMARPGEAGVVVRDVLRGAPAERAGLRSGDRIVTIDGELVSRPPDIVRIVSRHHAGQRLSLGLVRDGADRLLAVALGARPDESALLRSQFIGVPAPRWQELATVRGSLPEDLAGLRGRVVVIDFWASWCVACRLAIPTLNAWHDRYSARGLTVVGVTTDSAEIAMEASVELGIEYAVASDPEGDTSRAYKAMAIPTLFVVDREGTVRDVMVGYSSDRLAEVEETLRSLMGGT